MPSSGWCDPLVEVTISSTAASTSDHEQMRSEPIPSTSGLDEYVVQPAGHANDMTLWVIPQRWSQHCVTISLICNCTPIISWQISKSVRPDTVHFSWDLTTITDCRVVDGHADSWILPLHQLYFDYTQSPGLHCVSPANSIIILANYANKINFLFSYINKYNGIQTSVIHLV